MTRKILKMTSLKILFVLMLCVLSSFAQKAVGSGFENVPRSDESYKAEKSLSIALNLAHYFPTEEAEQLNLKSSLFNLGIESLFSVGLKANLIFSTGLNLQSGKISRSNQYKERIKFTELSIPFLITKPVFENTVDGIFISSGVYLGQYVQSILETKSVMIDQNSEWHELSPEYIDSYTDNNLLADFYLGIAYQNKAVRTNHFRFELFTKYKLKEYWINENISRWVLGAKIVYSLKI
ncbi:hypothetical protein [uncultured Draconibacterium sp.]|uniref:hypothetical protein n=1 Tax=uncultured Draconibacterium sp. TaxID=1573823 RepID=UPI0032179972